MTATTPAIVSLERLTDDTGIMEHAWYAVPRRTHGYCTDDNGRALAIACQIGGDEAIPLAETYLAFLVHAHQGDGSFRLRLGYDRRWTSDSTSDDANGRALFGLGTAAAIGPASHLRVASLAIFDQACTFRSPYWRATSHAVQGASAVLGQYPAHGGAHKVLLDAAHSLPRPRPDNRWPWPEDALNYESPRLPQALMQVGVAIDDEEITADGLALLRWLIDRDTHGNLLSLPPAGHRDLDEEAIDRGYFDQQPVEAWALADAAAVAQQIAPAPEFSRAIEQAAAWFEGRNPAGRAMVDPSTGGAYDGLEVSGVNLNQGAESLLALLGTQHRFHELARHNHHRPIGAQR